MDHGSERGDDRLLVSVDHDLCSGTAHCAHSYTEVFEIRNAKSWVREDADWDSIEIDRLREAETTCPWFAITVRVAGDA